MVNGRISITLYHTFNFLFIYRVSLTISRQDDVFFRRYLVSGLRPAMAATRLQYTVQLYLLRETACSYSCDVSLSVFNLSFGEVDAQWLMESSMQDEAPVRYGVGKKCKLIQGTNFSRWTCRWRTILLSSLGKTMYPYSQYLRTLNLGDLEHLLRESVLSVLSDKDSK